MSALVDVADIIQTVLDYDGTKIIIGRENATQDNFTEDYIIVDELVSVPIAQRKSFNSDTEVETHTTQLMGTFTIEFYGNESRNNRNNLLNLQNSQEFYDACKEKNLFAYKIKNTNNRKMKINTTFYERYEAELVVKYNIKTEIERLKVEEIPLEFLKEN